MENLGTLWKLYQEENANLSQLLNRLTRSSKKKQTHLQILILLTSISSTPHDMYSFNQNYYKTHKEEKIRYTMSRIKTFISTRFRCARCSNYQKGFDITLINMLTLKKKKLFTSKRSLFKNSRKIPTRDKQTTVKNKQV